MVIADIDVVVDAGVTLLGIRVLEAEGILRPGGEVGAILEAVCGTVNVVPSCDNAGCHVVQTPLWDGAIEHSHGEVGSLSND